MTKMIPLKVAEKGLTAWYVELSHKIDLARAEVIEYELEHTECVRQLYNLIAYDYGNGVPSPVSIGYDGEIPNKGGDFAPWTHALLVEEVAKRLPEIVGKMKEAQLRCDELIAEMKEVFDN